jgi:DNA-binding NarL/FixJ family response regulator
MKVLIVDDNAGYRAALRGLLEDQFPAIEVVQAGSVEDGLAMARAPGLELVFMDLRLQPGSGFAFTRALKDARPRCIVCVISSYALPEYRQAALDSGADHFLAKGEASACEIVSIVASVLHVAARG